MNTLPMLDIMNPVLKHTRDAYGEVLVELGAKDRTIVVLDADVADSTRSHKFGEKFPQRFFNLGVSEQDMMGTAVGLALSGYKVFASTFAVFTARCFDQIRYTVAYHNANVKLIGTHSGIGFGEDGASAHALNDIAIIRAVPNIVVMVPCDYNSTRRVVKYAAETAGPFYIRLIRQETPVIYETEDEFSLGAANILRSGSDVSLVACGSMVFESLKAATILEKNGYKASVIDMCTVKPLDIDTLFCAAKETGRVVTVEDHSMIGGLGSAVAENLAERYPCPLRRIGIKDMFAESGSYGQLYEKYGLSGPRIADAVLDFVRRIRR